MPLPGNARASAKRVSYPYHRSGDDCDVEQVSPRQCRAQGVVPDTAVALDPVQPPAALTPAEHAALAPRLARTPLLALVRDDALREKHDALACVAQPMSEVDLLVV